jgi:hypothetical protein
MNVNDERGAGKSPRAAFAIDAVPPSLNANS